MTSGLPVIQAQSQGASRWAVETSRSLPGVLMKREPREAQSLKRPLLVPQFTGAL
jgi:hypothetical protein